MSGATARQRGPELFAESRVAASEYFSRFFLLRVPPGELTDATFDRLLRSAADRHNFVAELRAVGSQGLYRDFFLRLIAVVDDIDSTRIEALVTGIFDVGDSVPRERTPSFAASSDLVARIAASALQKRFPQEERLAVVQRCFAETTGLYLQWSGSPANFSERARRGRPMTTS